MLMVFKVIKNMNENESRTHNVLVFLRNKMSINCKRRIATNKYSVLFIKKYAALLLQIYKNDTLLTHFTSSVGTTRFVLRDDTEDRKY